jgi:branched-chain amino acid transport system ATP-binding protein
MEQMLFIQNLMVFFENALALNDLSIEVGKGEIVGILGSNSAGKTTLMNTVSGLIIDMKKKEDRRGGERISVIGELKFEEEDILNMKPSERVKRGIVLSRERHPIFRDSDVLENLKIAGYLHKRREVKERIDSIFQLFPHLKGMKKRKAGLLSGGEQQMLAIGRALMAQPKLLLLDEPLLGLSPLMEAMLARAIRDINQQTGITIMISEQYARPILPIIHHGYILENGGAVLEGSSQELMENPDVKSAYFGL